MKGFVRCTVFVGFGLLVVACAGGSATRGTVMVCDPVCSERPASQINQDIRNIPEEDAKLAALKAEAEQNPLAAHDLALRYFRGDGVPLSPHKAITWMRAAAEKGDLGAQKALGSLYLTGLGEMGADPGEATIWLSIAAARGDQESKELLATAGAANRSRKDEFQWFQKHRYLIHHWWQSGYMYYGAWNGRWWDYTLRAHK